MMPSRQLFACVFARASGDLSKQSIADAFGVKLKTVNHWAAGRVRVPFRAVSVLCAAVGMDPAPWLLALTAQYEAPDDAPTTTNGDPALALAFPALWAAVERLGGLPPVDPLEPSAIKAGRFIYADGEILNRDPAHLRDDAGDGWGDRPALSDARP